MLAISFILLSSIGWSLSYDEKYYKKLAKEHYELDWLECCNDKFYPDEIHKIASDLYNQCRKEIGEDKSACFYTCVFRNMGLYDETGFHKEGWMKVLGPETMLGDSNDWKKKEYGKIIDVCFKEIDQKATHDCNEDLKKFLTCWWASWFNNCPSFNPEKC